MKCAREVVKQETKKLLNKLHLAFRVLAEDVSLLTVEGNGSTETKTYLVR